MKPLYLLRGLYRQMKTPAMHVSKEKNAVTLVAKTQAASTTTSTGNDKSRSNASTKFLMQQYRVAVSLSPPIDHAASAIAAENGNRTTIAHSIPQQLHRFATELYLLRQDIHQRGELYMLDTGADQQLSPHELSRRAAARAGLQLPEQYEE